MRHARISQEIQILEMNINWSANKKLNYLSVMTFNLHVATVKDNKVVVGEYELVMFGLQTAKGHGVIVKSSVQKTKRQWRCST